MKHNFEDFLSNIGEQHNIKTLHAYDATSMRTFCDSEGSPTMEITFKCEINRRSGKTTRRILRAIFNASEGYNVYFVTRNMATAVTVSDRIRDTLNVLGVDCWFKKSTTNIKGGGKVEPISKEWFDRRQDEFTKGIRNIKIIEDLD